MIPPMANEANIAHYSRTNDRHPEADTPKELCTPTIPEARLYVQQSRIEEISTETIMGSCH